MTRSCESASHPVGQSTALCLRLVGSIEISGLRRPLTSQQLSMVTYLSCIGPADRDVLIDAIWDGRPISAGRFANLVTDLRGRLGKAYLPPALAGRYRLVGLRSDLDVLAGVADVSAGQHGATPTSNLARAVEEIVGRARGPVLGRPGVRYWTWLDDHPEVVARVEVAVAGAALEVVGILTKAGHLDRARSICEGALASCPLDRQLIEALEALHRAQGRPGTAARLVERWWARAHRVGETSPGAVGAPAAPTAQTSIRSAVTT